jgi:inosine/xanthosine triphosphatase
MIIAVATENPAKINACSTVLEKIRLSDNGNKPRLITRSTASNVSEMPLSLNEMLTGARNRAVNIFRDLTAENYKTAFSIGMEGGFFLQYLSGEQKQLVFLQSWAYVYNGKSGHFGSSGAIPVPEAVYRDVISGNEELAQVIDRHARQTDIRSRQGAVGVFTDNHVLRQDLFETALIFAFAPYYNERFYNFTEA